MILDENGEKEQQRLSYNLFNLGRSSGQNVMIATSDNSYSSSRMVVRDWRSSKPYTKEEVEKIIDSGSLDEQVKLSRVFFMRDGFYKQLITYYATLIYYRGILIPNPSIGQSLQTPYILKHYYQANNFIERIDLGSFFTNCAIKALVDGCYYGVIQNMTKEVFSVIDLPSQYCRSRFKDKAGNDIIEFNLNYFLVISDEKTREIALDTYPEIFRQAFTAWRNGKTTDSWFMIPTDISICFPMIDERPFFLHVIPSSMDYDETVEINLERDLEEIRKIIVQKIPHNNENQLLFEPDEALEIHEGTVEMMKGNKNVSILTTYADVDAITSSSSSEANANMIERSLQHVFNKAGVSSQLFSSTGSTTLKASINKDIAVMWALVHKFENFLNNIVNRIYGNSNITFKFLFLPVGKHNEEDYISMYKDMASLGYSWLLPAAAMGLNQQDLVNLKVLENDILKLPEKLIPLSSAYNAQNDGSEGKRTGAPAKKQEDKAEQTIKNETSKDNSVGGSK